MWIRTLAVNFTTSSQHEPFWLPFRIFRGAHKQILWTILLKLVFSLLKVQRMASMCAWMCTGTPCMDTDVHVCACLSPVRVDFFPWWVPGSGDWALVTREHMVPPPCFSLYLVGASLAPLPPFLVHLCLMKTYLHCASWRPEKVNLVRPVQSPH